MIRLGDIVPKVRSKNAGPFWLTIDIFCGNTATFTQTSRQLKTRAVAEALDMDQFQIKRFDIADLNVIKLSMPRPSTQGASTDRDMHGASFGQLIQDLMI